MTDILYQLDHIIKSYAGRVTPALALDEPLTIARGEALAIVGPNGAGKSTLLRLLALLEPPTSGALELLGVRLDAGARPPLALRRRIALVFQRPILLNTTVRANVAYGLRVRGVRDTDERVERALAQVGLRELRDKPARTLSGGEAQRVALARALVIEPDVLLLDEPTANLDPYNVSLIEQIVTETHATQRTTFVIVTHNVFQARRLADRVGLLLNGRLVEISACEDFFERPNDPRTRAFVRGEMVY
ncbi:MAG: ATP-binding cassette domain-containing protein [Chloroflexota bacterium]